MHQTSGHHASHAAAGTAERNAGADDRGQHGASADHTQPAPSLVAIAGHPLHAMLIPFPIALLLGALVSDVAAWWTGDPFAARAALWLNGAGVLIGGLAATFGLADFLSIERARAHTVGWVHALGAGATLVLATASWLVRLSDSPGLTSPWAFGLMAVSAGVLGVTAWAGGDLPYRHLIGVAGHGAHTGGHGAAEESGPHADGHGQHAPPTTVGDGHPADHHGAKPEGQRGQQAQPERGDGRSGDDRHGEHDREGRAPAGHQGMAHADTSPAFAVTGAQLTAVSLLTLLALVGAVIWSASFANLTLSAREVGGLVMAPGMVMTRQTSAETMRDMAAIDPRQVRFGATIDARGDQSLQPRVEDGVKVFDLEASAIEWPVLPNVPTMAYAFNGQVPGPRIRLTEGDQVRLNVTNRLPESTTVHWHGLILPNRMDGPAEVTQPPIRPGETYTYQFVAQQPGTFFHHSHDHPDRQQGLGLYGALIVDRRDRAAEPAYEQELVVQLQEWLFRDGYTFPAMPMEGAMPNYFTINGKSYPATETVNLRVGERLRVRFIGSSNGFIHPMHIHGGPFTIVETDGYPVPQGAKLVKDTVNVGPGERYDVIWEAREPGQWLLHCHINHHATNDGREEQGGGGLMLILNVT